MSNPSGPDDRADTDEATEVTEVHADPPTEVFAASEDTPAAPAVTPEERRFTAPSGMDAGSTQIIDRAPDPATEIFNVPADATKAAAPQAIPPRGDAPKLPTKGRSWGWVLAVILVIAALVAVAVLATVLLTRKSTPAISQEDRVRDTIQGFDTAIQTGDLAALRSITCGETAASYNRYNEAQWSDTHARVAAAKQYPVVASVDQVIVNGEHAEANVTTFMAFDPATRSTRSLDLLFRDEQWKICQTPGN
jgi:Domain of unknown function (DUF4878)